MFRRKTLLLITTIMLLSVSLLSGIEARPAHAQAGQTITVTGIGTASGQPDIATVEIGYQILNTQLANAFNNGNTAMVSITQALLDQGIAQSDIQLVAYNVTPNDRGQGGVPTGNFIYRFSQILRVTIRDISKVNQIITAVVAQGANVVQNFAFGIDNVDALETQARTEAIKNARARADQLATGLGVYVSDAINITDNVTVNNIVPTGSGSRGAVVQLPEEGSAVPLAGQFIVTVQVGITFTLRTQP